MNGTELWRRYQKHLCSCPGLGISLDISRVPFPDDFFSRMAPAMDKAYDAMARLEAGEIANPDENRMVGHYWLRAPELAPSDDIADAIRQTNRQIVEFVQAVHQKNITPPNAPRFTDLLLIGIGGSALGPQLVADCLGTKRDKLKVHFIDNTDPDGIERVHAQIGARLKSTLVVVISKSGGTPEPRNGMLETQALFAKQGLDFPKQAVAVTGEGSNLDQTAEREGWLKRFAMWDWVGGRTSVTSAVGLLPAALQGLDIQGLLDGAAKMDGITRQPNTPKNPAALLALMWHFLTNGRGEKDMVVLPYKDRLLLLSRYLQQLVMESLGKEKDLDGNTVHQGIAVYGNKGSTDQHAYVQQLRDGLNNFFVNFIVVLQDNPRPGRVQPIEVEPGVTTGDYLNGFWQGTREALYESGRASVTITAEKLDARTLGALIALYERAVGFYASLININAYHQPGVEAGKKAAAAVLSLQNETVRCLQNANGQAMTAEEIAQALGQPERVESIHHILEHLAGNKRGVKRSRNRYVVTG
ncbi:MAG: glucose-6-phosphate isomerase [Phycisphaeraceae bacterium]